MKLSHAEGKYKQKISWELSDLSKFVSCFKQAKNQKSFIFRFKKLI